MSLEKIAREINRMDKTESVLGLALVSEKRLGSTRKKLQDETDWRKTVYLNELGKVYSTIANLAMDRYKELKSY